MSDTLYNKFGNDYIELKKFLWKEAISKNIFSSTEVPIYILKQLHEMGVFQAHILSKYGGQELNTTELLKLSWILAYASPGVFTTFTANMVASLCMCLYGNEQINQEIFNSYPNNFSLWSLCVTEPDSGTDISNSKMCAKKVEGGFIINGEKTFITNASLSSHLVVLARTKPISERRNALSFFYVDSNTPGISRGNPLEKIGHHHSNTANLFFDDVFVPHKNLLGHEGDGLKILAHCIQRSKTLIAGAGVGICDRADDLLKNNLIVKMRYGKPLISQPTILSLLAELRTEIEASWHLAVNAATSWDKGGSAIKEASMAKLFSSNTTVKFLSEALELFGAYGYSKECEISQLFADAKLLEIYEGASLVQKQIIAKEIYPEAFEKRNPIKLSA